jgi:hypothetical protein
MCKPGSCVDKARLSQEDSIYVSSSAKTQWLSGISAGMGNTPPPKLIISKEILKYGKELNMLKKRMGLNTWILTL